MSDQSAPPPWMDLPPHPSYCPMGSIEAAVSAFKWAHCMIQLHGSTAPHYALNAIMICIKNQDHHLVPGWKHVMDAITELGRTADEGDIVH